MVYIDKNEEKFKKKNKKINAVLNWNKFMQKKIPYNVFFTLPLTHESPTNNTFTCSPSDTDTRDNDPYRSVIKNWIQIATKCLFY